MYNGPLTEKRVLVVTTLTLVPFGPSVNVASLSRALRPAQKQGSAIMEIAPVGKLHLTTEEELLGSSGLPLPEAAYLTPSCPLCSVPCQSLSIQYPQLCPERPDKRIGFLGSRILGSCERFTVGAVN